MASRSKARRQNEPNAPSVAAAASASLAVGMAGIAGPGNEITLGADAVAARGTRSFLAQELGGAVGEDGEILGVSLKDLFLDPHLKAMALRYWQQMQGKKALDEKTLEQAGLTVSDLFAPGLTESVSSSSSPQELERYRTKLEFRADLLEALLEETIAELEGLERLQPSDEIELQPSDSMPKGGLR